MHGISFSSPLLPLPNKLFPPLMFIILVGVQETHLSMSLSLVTPDMLALPLVTPLEQKFEGMDLEWAQRSEMTLLQQLQGDDWLIEQESSQAGFALVGL